MEQSKFYDCEIIMSIIIINLIWRNFSLKNLPLRWLRLLRMFEPCVFITFSVPLHVMASFFFVRPFRSVSLPTERLCVKRNYAIFSIFDYVESREKKTESKNKLFNTMLPYTTIHIFLPSPPPPSPTAALSNQYYIPRCVGDNVKKSIKLIDTNFINLKYTQIISVGYYVGCRLRLIKIVSFMRMGFFLVFLVLSDHKICFNGVWFAWTVSSVVGSEETLVWHIGTA